jgi:hypothetical protein
MTDTIDKYRDWDAAYVLGALDSVDRRDYERHLASCAECSAGLAELAGLPGILGKVSADDAVALLMEEDITAGVDDHLRDGVHTPGLVQRLAISARRRRRRVRFGILGAAVAVVALVTVGGIGYSALQTPTPAAVAMAPIGQHVVTASMRVSSQPWGTRFDWSCSYTSGAWHDSGSDGAYDLVVIEKSGVTKTVASWTGDTAEVKGLTASTDIATAEISRIEIRFRGSTTPLLQETL